MTRRFVVQEHTVGPGDVHYDLMIEDGAALVTVQLDAPPRGEATPGRRSFDHRPRYLSYEGPISRGRGSVRIWDAGEVEDLLAEPRAARWRGRFRGRALRGDYELSAQPAGADGSALVLRRVEATP